MADWLSKFIEDLFPSKETLRAKSVTLFEAAALLYLDTAEVQRLAARGKLKLINLDGETRVMKPSLKAYYHANQEAINQRRAEAERERERVEAEAEQERRRAKAKRERKRAERERKRAERERKRAEQERKRAEQERKRVEPLLTRIFVHSGVEDPLLDPSRRKDALRKLLRRNRQDAQARLELGVCLIIESLGYDWLSPEMHADPQEPCPRTAFRPLAGISQELLRAMSLGLDTALLNGVAHFFYAVVTSHYAQAKHNYAMKTYPPGSENQDKALSEVKRADEMADTALKESMRQFRRWLRSNPHDLNTLHFLAAAYKRLGRMADAEKTGLEIAKAEQLQNLGVLGAKRKSRKRQASSTQAKGIAFEELCLRLVKAMGFSATTTSVTADGGIDIVATSTQPVFSGKYIIQCKDWSNTVGEPIVRDLYGVVHAENANKGILIATSKFTKAAQRFAEGKPLELIDGEQFNDLLKQYKIQ